ncbi:MAG: nucleotidyltransferase domain-containing protein, partial [Chloroflexota bacterium]
GNGVYRMVEGGEWIFPAEGFTGIGLVADRSVQCLSPAVQVLCHAGGYEPDEDDRRDMRALRDRFGVTLPPGLA